MSLINEALKKAQRTRTGDLSGNLPPMPGGGGRVAKRSQPRTSQQLILIAAGAIALVVLSVVATVYLVNRPSEPKLSAPVPVVAPAPKPPQVPPIVAPVLNPPVLTTRPAAETPPAVPQTPPTEKAPAPTPPAPTEIKPTAPGPIAIAPQTAPAPATPAPRTPATTSPAPSPASTAPAPAPVVTTPTPTPAPVPAAAPVIAAAPPAPVVTAPKHDERVNQFVDAIRVAGIRSSGTESRVLMNDRVFRVNEIVERNFGLRLTKVEANTLTFTDANGAVYVKNF